MAIQSFSDKITEALFEGQRPRSIPPDLMTVTRRKLAMLGAAAVLNDLRSPPGNRFESLKGDCKGQHSIRINDQYRLCFVWTAAGLSMWSLRTTTETSG